MKFSELDLKPELQESLKRMGYEEMTPIQEQTIPHVIKGADVMGLAETGSGKTAACGVPLVNATDVDLNAIQHLILVPTRELALQYVQEVDDLAGDSGVVPFAVFGGFEEMAIFEIAFDLRAIGEADPQRRFSLWSPFTGETPIYVHAKIMIADDRLLKIGSANLNIPSNPYTDLCLVVGPSSLSPIM